MTEAQERKETRIALPWPPSTNNLFVNKGRRRFVSQEYAAWRREAGWTLQAQRPPKFLGQVEIGIELCAPHRRRYDLDNRVKATLDLLTEHRVIRDDSDPWVRAVSVRRVENAAPCVVTVRAVP